jgi:hypothetical protein
VHAAFQPEGGGYEGDGHHHGRDHGHGVHHHE